LWLPRELPAARILTFGYNAHFSSTVERASCNIADFAADLLFRMKYGENTPERLGQVPIVVVAHSMGGLVFKKAFVQGHLNSEFTGIVSMIKAVLFLATPHRGADLAETLNKVLSTSVFGYSPKEYVAELTRKSPTIDDLNEAFRHHAPKLRIFSFYETLATRIGPVSTMVVDKPSAVMGYAGETQTPLAANHHDVCKFKGPGDPNYVSVTGALRSISASLTISTTVGTSREELQHLADLLGVTGPPEEDFRLGCSTRKEGTCEGFWASEELNNWLHSDSSRVLWVYGPPGAGKSTLCSFVTERLLQGGHHCSYFFFKYRQRNKQSAANMLLSIAHQTALRQPAFRSALANFAKSGERLSGADPLIIWQKLFTPTLIGSKTSNTLYWVIDGLDEAESRKQVVEFISRVTIFEGRVRVLILSRPLPDIQHEFLLAKKKIPVVEMPLPDNQDDIRLVVAEGIDHLLSSNDFKSEVVNGIAARSQGSFLWASLVTQNVLSCRREDQVRRLLDSTPDGMEPFYDRMRVAILELTVNEDKTLSQVLLVWAMYAIGPITVEELSEVYPTEFSAVMDIHHTISQVCGQFVVVSPEGRITLVHHSAREYLKGAEFQAFNLPPKQANEQLLKKCLEALCDRGLKRKLVTLKVPLFLSYAATSWSTHLEECSPESNEALDALVRFFDGPYPLAWIQYLAMSGRLSELFSASRRLAAYVKNRRKADTDKSPMLHRLTHLSLLETWAVDLMKLPAKFGHHLSESPALIYQCIPSLSPASSIIHQKFNKNPAATLSVTGLSNEEWDDCLARVSGGPGRALRLAASPLYLAVVSDEPRGAITVWGTKLFEEHKALFCGEHIWALAFNHSGSVLACYSLSTTYVWKVADWSLQLSAKNPRLERAIEFKFDGGDILMMISEQRRVYKLDTGHTRATPVWEQQDAALLDEPGVPEGMFLNTPSCVAFNSDCTQIAVAYRSFPLSIWTVDPPQMIARLRRRRSRHGQGSENSYTGDNKVVWHPSGTEVIGIYGQIFKWRPENDKYEEAKDETGVVPHGLACSPDGKVFITMDVGGSIKIYDVASLCLIYKLTSEDRIDQISFSPDSPRFYDLRGSYCNIWEPNFLLRLADSASEQISDTESAADDFWSDTADTPSTSISIPISESHSESRPAITAVEPGRESNGLLIAHTNEDGTINIYDTIERKKHEIGKAMFRMTVEHLSWSPKQDILAYSLASGATTVKAVRVEYNGERSILTEVVYSEKRSPTDRGRTRQLLFHGTGSRLLVYGTKKCQILSLPEGAVLAELPLSDKQEPAKWHQHPSQTETLLFFTGQLVTAFSWSNLEQTTSSISLDLSRPGAHADDNYAPSAIDAILDSYSTRYLLLRTVTMHHNRPRYDFAVLPTQPLYARGSTSTSSFSAPIVALPLPIPLSHSQIHAIGILPDSRLVFLDRQLWVCTTALHGTTSLSPSGPADTGIRRHFFLPHDWVTAQGLRLCRLLKDGTVLCPTKGQVAVVKGDLVQEC
jgi:WD40 repeat protein